MISNQGYENPDPRAVVICSNCYSGNFQHRMNCSELKQIHVTDVPHNALKTTYWEMLLQQLC